MSDPDRPPTPVHSSQDERIKSFALDTLTAITGLSAEVARLSGKLEALEKKDRTSGIVVLVVSLVLQIAASNVWRFGYVG